MLQYFSKERTLEDNVYMPEDFLFRWKKLQRVLAKEGVDGLLIATGLDAKDSVYSAYIFNWLFLGLSGKSITINKYLDSIYSEIIIVISPKGSHIFITPEAKQNLQTLIYSIPNCKIFCPTEKQYENKQLLDTLKIATFYGMVQPLQKIAVFLGQNEDVKLIQKWPLIQSYALEPVGRTFFTLKHQSVNLYSKIAPLFRNLDKYSLKNLVNRTAYAMEGHVKGSLMQIQLKNQEERKNISQTLIQESLQEAVDIQVFQSGSFGYKGFVRVLFGQRTNSEQISSIQATINSINPIHLTVEHYDPYTKMKVWRTYFLSLSSKIKEEIYSRQIEEEDSFLTKNDYHIRHVPNTRFDDQNLLIELYASLVQNTLESISAVSKDYRNLNNQFISSFVFSKISQTCKQLFGAELIKPENLITEIESFDSFGEARPIDFKDSISFKLTSTFYVLKIKLKNILSPLTKKNLGSIIFSESFLIQQGCYMLLTKKTPYFDFWKCENSNAILGKLNPNIQFQQLGKPLTPEGFKNRIFIPCQKLSYSHLNIPVLDVKYYFHQNGLRIYGDKIGWKLLFYSDLEDVTMINKIPGEWVIMKNKKAFLFEGLQNNIIGIQFRGKAFQYLMELTKRKKNPLEITYIEAIPSILSENWYFTTQVLRRSVKDGQFLHQHQILVPDFLWSFIESKQMMIINQMKDLKISAFKNLYQSKLQRKKEKVEAPGEKHSLLLITGSYGSGKLKLAQNLKKFGPNQLKTSIFNIFAENLYTKISENAFIQMIEQFIANNDTPKNQLIITVVPSWISLKTLLPLISQVFHISSVLTKVNASNFFSTKNLCLVENVLAYCVPGYTQNIVIDSFAEEQNIINSVMKIVENFNKEARIARSSNCLLTTGQCQDILLQATFTNNYQNFLRSKYGILFQFDQIADLSLNFVQFKLPIYDLSLIKNLTKTEGYLIDRKAVLKQIQHKKRQAENSKDELMMGLYFLEEVMTVIRKRNKAPQIRSIKGLCLARRPESDSEEKGFFQVNWSNQEYRLNEVGRQKRVNHNLGFSILCRRFDEVQIMKFIENLSYKTKLFGEPKQMKTVHSLSEKQIQEIEKEAIINNKYFQNDQYFDGYVLRNSEGFAIDHHPYLQQVLENTVNQWNASVSSHNAELRVKWNHYIETYTEQ